MAGGGGSVRGRRRSCLREKEVPVIGTGKHVDQIGFQEHRQVVGVALEVEGNYVTNYRMKRNKKGYLCLKTKEDWKLS